MHKPTTSPADCRTATALILDYLNETLAPESAEAFTEHLERCPDCAAFLNTYKKTVELTREFLSGGASPGPSPRRGRAAKRKRADSPSRRRA